MGNGEGGGGGGGGGGWERQLVPEGGISYEWGGAAAPPEPMLDPGLRPTSTRMHVEIERVGSVKPEIISGQTA